MVPGSGDFEWRLDLALELRDVFGDFVEGVDGCDLASELNGFSIAGEMLETMGSLPLQTFPV